MFLSKEEAVTKKYYFIIYKVFDEKFKKVYIGQHKIKNGIENDGYLGSGSLLLKEINARGTKDFKKYILYRVSTQEEANKLEREIIRKYNSTNPVIGYNILEGPSKKKKSFLRTIKKRTQRYWSQYNRTQRRRR